MNYKEMDTDTLTKWLKLETEFLQQDKYTLSCTEGNIRRLQVERWLKGMEIRDKEKEIRKLKRELASRGKHGKKVQ
jgi:hypothetical protein